MSIDLIFFQTSATAKTPVRGSSLAAGYDLVADSAVTLAPGHRALIPTGIGVILPHGFYGRVAPRSGLAYKQGLDVLAGVIDEDYRGTIGVILINLGDAPVTINAGDKIAQLVIERYLAADEVRESVYTERQARLLPIYSTARGTGGYGSTDAT